jgi:hypothetical protein
MREVACSHEAESFDFGKPSYFRQIHSLACSSAKTAVNVQVSDDFHGVSATLKSLLTILKLMFSAREESEFSN